MTLETRSRVKSDSDLAFQITTQKVEWDLEKTAIIICDMWDTHHCFSTAARVAEMAPHTNEVVTGIRKKGALIIHAPSGCVAFYDKTPQRKRAQEAPFVEASVEFRWNGWKQRREIQQLEESPLPAGITEPGPCSCHTAEPCCGEGEHPWIRQIETIEIAGEDAISDDGQEVYNLLQQRGIENVMVMGVATNVCVLGRPFGLRQLVYLGKKPLLCRDLTDSHHSDDGGHFHGTDLTIEHIEKYWCPSVTSDQLVGGKPFRFRDDERAQM
jgi:nicotinamidase-related amidase